MVLASSSSVYGGTVREASVEHGATSPLSPYGVTKLAAERLAFAYAQRAASSLSVIALRYFSVYGPRQRPDMWISRVLWAARTGNPVTLFGDGSQRRDFTFVDDVVAATLTAGNASVGAHVVNVGTGVTRSVRDVIEIAGCLSGRPVPLLKEPSAAGDVDVTWADTGRASRLLGHNAITDLETGMAAQWSWMSTGRSATRTSDAVQAARQQAG